MAYAVRPGPGRERALTAVRFSACALGAALAIYVPVVATAGLGDSFDLLVRYPLEDFSDYQSLPFPLDYDGPLNTGSVGGFFSDSAENLLVFYLPLALVLGLAGALAALASRFDRERWWQAAAAVFAVGMAHYLVTRPDLFHTAPLAVMVAVLGAWAMAGRREPGRAPPARLPAPCSPPLRSRSPSWRGSTGAGSSCGRSTWRWTCPPPTACACGRGFASRSSVRCAGCVSARRQVSRSTWPPAAADLVTSGAPLLYVLADRPNPTPYDIQAPGVVTSAPVQREIVRDLERSGTDVVVRFTDPVTAAPEPNLAGESSGVTLLDDHLRRAYRRVARFGPWVILERR